MGATSSGEPSELSRNVVDPAAGVDREQKSHLVSLSERLDGAQVDLDVIAAEVREVGEVSVQGTAGV
ncbi:hypothetical protein MTO96_018834 [Rhipicephalus appendiculatus]